MFLVRLLPSARRPLPLTTLRRRHLGSWLPTVSASRNTSDPIGASNLITDLGTVSAELPVPEHIAKPDYYYSGGTPAPHPHQTTAEIHTPDAIRRLRRSCLLAARILHSCAALVHAGTTTDQIDRHVHAATLAAGAYPSPLRYNGFPKSVCTSVNNVACHGIPDDRPLADGDVINVDVTVLLDGFHGDCSRMFHVAGPRAADDERGRFLCDVTERCLNAGIAVCAPGVPMRAIGCTIARVARQSGVSVVPAFVGHGIGRYFHGAPQVLHYYNAEQGEPMAEGMVFTVEPVISLGGEEVELQEDGWTAMTVDGARTAQMEHTVLVTADGCEVLTRWEEEKNESEKEMNG